MSVISTRYHGDIDDRSDPRRSFTSTLWFLIAFELSPAFDRSSVLRLHHRARHCVSYHLAGCWNAQWQPALVEYPSHFPTFSWQGICEHPAKVHQKFNIIQSQIIKLSNIHHKSIEKDSKQIRNQWKFIVNPSNIHENSNHLWTYLSKKTCQAMLSHVKSIQIMEPSLVKTSTSTIINPQKRLGFLHLPGGLCRSQQRGELRPGLPPPQRGGQIRVPRLVGGALVEIPWKGWKIHPWKGWKIHGKIHGKIWSFRKFIWMKINGGGFRNEWFY